MYVPPFTVTSEILHLVSEISERVGAINVTLGDNAPSPMLRKDNRIKTIHSSLAIEHNSLSLQQVTDIIDGKHVLGAPNEIQEVKNAVQAYQLMQHLDAFKEKDLLKAHGLMMKDLVENAGRYRNGSVGVFDGEKCIHLAPPAARVPQLIGELFEWVKSTDIHPLISSCVFHYEFEFIHPFMDGNGRMGRYWQTMLLARWKGIFAWIPVETIVKAHQQEYYNAIAVSDANGECTSFISFMLKCLLDSICEFDVTDKVADKVAERPLSDNENKILNLISKNNYITIGEISVKTRLSDSGIRKIISLLKKKGIITRLGSRKKGHWVVNR
ncbi:MAG: Fic family protein [Bacteroidales bacterium]|nr:Fic family protein [Bacteroidales bacterium]